MKSLAEPAIKPCDACDTVGQLLQGRNTVCCGDCGGRGFRYVDCLLCLDTMLLGGIPCECSTIGGAA